MGYNNDELKLHYDIASRDYLKAGEASSNIKKLITKLGFDTYTVNRVCTSCYEAEMNIAIHSFGGYLELRILGNTIEIKAEDKGPGISNIERAMTKGYSTATESARKMGFGAGIGLSNIKSNCDELIIKSIPGKNTKMCMIIKY